MAMGREAISQCRSDVAYFNGSWENANYKAVYDSIQGDPEYQNFISQTDLGRELNTKMGAMLDLYGNLWNTLGDLGDKTRNFLNVQEALNSSTMNNSSGSYSDGSGINNVSNGGTYSGDVPNYSQVYSSAGAPPGNSPAVEVKPLPSYPDSGNFDLNVYGGDK